MNGKEFYYELEMLYASMNRCVDYMLNQRDKDMKRHGVELSGAANIVADWLNELIEFKEEN